MVVNQPARLECEATGVPPPSFTWLKDGSPVASGLRGLQVGLLVWRLVFSPNGVTTPFTAILASNL